MKVNTIVSIFISANLYAKSAVAVEEQLNHNLRRLAKPSCGDGKVSGKEDCEPPDTATCDANCKAIVGPTCATVRFRCADACTKDDAGLNCDVGTTCKRCNENDVGCTSNDCTLTDGTVCVEQSFKCVPTPECIDPITGVCECATVNCLIDPCETAKCGSGEVCKSNFCGGCNAVCEPDEIVTTAATKPLTTATTTESAVSVCAVANCRASVRSVQIYQARRPRRLYSRRYLFFYSFSSCYSVLSNLQINYYETSPQSTSHTFIFKSCWPLTQR